jgi:putative ABC transport system substrate-binding protein
LAASFYFRCCAGFRPPRCGGGLLQYGPDFRVLQRRLAFYIDRILRGTKPSDLPVELPTKYIFIINLTTAKALGLAVPDTLLALADEVID